MELSVLQRQVEHWAADTFGPDVWIEGLEPMPGHAGLSFGFRVVDAGGTVLEDLVVRMPPKGVRRKGNTDVIRQVPLLQALRDAGVPVAEVRYWSEDERWFEVPFFMVGRLPGSVYVVLHPDPSFDGVSPATIFEQAVDALATIHTFDWRTRLPNWAPMRDLVDEIHYWDPILPKAAESEWIGMGEETRELLLARVPSTPVEGVFHGDFQTNNLLFDGPGLVAVLDWEISGMGAQLLDLGWLLMMNDPHSWQHGAGLAVVPSFGGLVDRYAAATGRAVTLADVAWYRALAGYRFGVISCLNVMLHRTGKRSDPSWEAIGQSVPLLFGRARDLLRGDAAE